LEKTSDGPLEGCRSNPKTGKPLREMGGQLGESSKNGSKRAENLPKIFGRDMDGGDKTGEDSIPGKKEKREKGH